MGDSDGAGDEVEEKRDGEDGVDHDEIMSFTENCSHCRNPVETKMKQVGKEECLVLLLVSNVLRFNI